MTRRRWRYKFDGEDFWRSFDSVGGTHKEALEQLKDHLFTQPSHKYLCETRELTCKILCNAARRTK